jgi:hypothetical protein
MKRGGRQSNNVEIQTEKQRKVAEAGYALQERQKTSPLTVNEGEPIAYAVDGKGGPNPGTKSAASKPASIKDPVPGKFTKSNDNYGDLPFFQHTTKDLMK